MEIRAGEPDASSRKLSGGDRRKLRTLIQSRNLNLYSLTPDWADINLASPNPMMRQESIREVKEAIELAWDLGAQYFTLPLGRRYSIGAAPIKKAEDWAFDSLESCLSFAEKSGVTICLQGYPGQVFGSAEGLLKVAQVPFEEPQNCRRRFNRARYKKFMAVELLRDPDWERSM